MLKDLNDVKQAEAAEDLADRFDEVCVQKNSGLNKSEGESLSLDELSEIYIQVKGEAR